MYTKHGLPAKRELVLCTVKKLEGHSAFLKLDEYDNKEGMLHTSEIERPWLRKLKSKLKPGTKVVCQVMRVDSRNNHINLSQKRVGAAQNRNKLAELKNEKMADGILKFFGKGNKLSVKEIYAQIGDKILSRYGLLYPVFIEISKGDTSVLKGLNIKLEKKFIDFVQDRLKIPKKVIIAKVNLFSRRGDGVEVVKQAFAEAEKIAKKHGVYIEINYLGAPKYRVKLTMEDYKVGEKVYKEIIEFLEGFLRKHEGDVRFKR